MKRRLVQQNFVSVAFIEFGTAVLSQLVGGYRRFLSSVSTNMFFV
jgi:hypothetical protein